MSKKAANVKSFLAKKKTRNEATVEQVSMMSSGHKKLSNWGTEDIVSWLKSQSFGEYANNFKEHSIAGHEFALMDMVDFHEIGITYGPSKRELVASKNKLIENLTDAPSQAQLDRSIPISSTQIASDAVELVIQSDAIFDEALILTPTKSPEKSQEKSQDLSLDDEEDGGYENPTNDAQMEESEEYEDEMPMGVSSMNLSAADRFRMYIHSKAMGKTEEEAVFEINELMKTFEEENDSIMMVGAQTDQINEESLDPLATLRKPKKSHTFSITNKKIFADAAQSLEEFRLYAEAHAHIITFCVPFGAGNSYNAFLQDLISTVESNSLPVSIVDCSVQDIQYFLSLLGHELVPHNKKTQMRLNFIAFYDGNSKEIVSMVKNTMIWLGASVTSQLKRMAYLSFFQDTSIEAGDGVLVCLANEYQRMKNFALGSTIYWFGGGIPSGYPAYCKSIGVQLEEVSSPLELNTLLFQDFSYLFNNHTNIRFVIQISGHKETLDLWVQKIREPTPQDKGNLQLRTPILLWSEKSRVDDKLNIDPAEAKYKQLGPEQVDYSIYAKFPRVSSTSDLPTLERYTAMDTELSWAPDIRLGSFFASYEWQGAGIIQEISCSNIGTAKRNFFAVISINNIKRLELGMTKCYTPVWKNLQFETEIGVEDEILVEVFEKETLGKEFKGQCKIPVATLMKECSSRTSQVICKTLLLTSKKMDSKTQKFTNTGLLSFTMSFLPDANISQHLKSLFPLMNTIENSHSFLLDSRYPTQENLINKMLVKAPKFPSPQLITLNDQILNTKIFVHARVYNLLKVFLTFKLKHGSSKEKEIYATMTPEIFAVRLVRKRPLVYFGSEDITTLRDLAKPNPSEWKNVGTDDEGKITMYDYLTNDEMCISSLIGVGTPTYFINDGNRRNAGEKGKPGTYEDQGVLIGVVGARFEHLDRMESRHMLVTEKYSTNELGYGQQREKNSHASKLLNVWAAFYNHDLPKTFNNQFDPESKDENIEVTPNESFYFPSYQEVDNDKEKNKKFMQVKDGSYFHIAHYKSRIRISIEIFILAAQYYAMTKSKDTKAYCHVVGLGLGVWQLCEEQALYILEVCNEIFLETYLPNVSDINFSWFPAITTQMGTVSNGQVFSANGNNVTVWFSKRNVCEPLNDSTGKKILVAMYAWDGNAFPGNEYWLGGSFITASGDPAAACCSLVAQTQNPLVNRFFCEYPWILDPALFQKQTTAVPETGNVLSPRGNAAGGKGKITGLKIKEFDSISKRTGAMSPRGNPLSPHSQLQREKSGKKSGNSTPRKPKTPRKDESKSELKIEEATILYQDI